MVLTYPGLEPGEAQTDKVQTQTALVIKVSPDLMAFWADMAFLPLPSNIQAAQITSLPRI